MGSLNDFPFVSSQAKYLFAAYPQLGLLDGLPMKGLTPETMGKWLAYALGQLKQAVATPGGSTDWIDAAFAGPLGAAEMWRTAKPELKEKAAQLLLKGLWDGAAQAGAKSVRPADWEGVRKLLDAVRLSVALDLEVGAVAPEAQGLSRSLWGLARVTGSRGAVILEDMKKEWDAAMQEAGGDPHDPNSETAIIAKKIGADIVSVDASLTKLEGKPEQMSHLKDALEVLVGRANALRQTDSELLAVLEPKLNAVLATAFDRASKVYTARAKPLVSRAPRSGIAIGSERQRSVTDHWDDWNLIDPDGPDLMKPAETERPTTSETGVEK